MKTMLRSFLFLTVLFATSVFAMPGWYTVKAQVFRDGNLIAKPTIKTIPNATAEIQVNTQVNNKRQELKMALTMSDVENNSVKVNTDIEYKENDKVIEKSSPVLMLKLNEEGVMRTKDGDHSFELRLVVSKD